MSRVGQVWEFQDVHTVETFVVLRARRDMWTVFFMEKNEVTNLYESTLRASEEGDAVFWRRLA